MSSYERTVTAAVAETRSKFALAEALALDIPPRRPGPSEDATISEYLAEAREAIIDGGGEARSVKTLADYRLTALWVSTGSGRNFPWVSGFSFNAHNEARQTGLSYDEFAAEPRTTDRIRRDAGKAGTDGPPARAIESWTPEQKAEAARELLADPAVAADIVEDVETRLSVGKALDKHRSQRAASPDDRPPEPETVHEVRGYSLKLLHRLRMARRVITEIVELSQDIRGPVADDLADAVTEHVEWMRAACDAIEVGANGGALDDQLQELLDAEAGQ